MAMASTAPPQLSYTPSAAERPYYELLFEEADRSRCGLIVGADAVAFLSRSKLPVALLKNIWLMADNPRSNSLDSHKFCVAVRLIQLYQNGQKAQGVDLAASGNGVIRPPFFEGSVPPAASQPPPAPVASQPLPQQLQPQQLQQHQLQPVVLENSPVMTTAIAPAQDAYFMSPSDQARYEALFPTYDLNKDGFVYGAEAVGLFSRSGLNNEQLRDIWNISDDPVDNRLSKVEFSIALHLIVCVSRKSLPLPGTLPPSLATLKRIQSPPLASTSPQPILAAPAAYTYVQPQPQYAAAPAIPAVVIPLAPPSPTQSIDTARSYNMAQGKPPLGPSLSKMSISDAFSNLSNEPHDTNSVATTTTLPPSSPGLQPTNEQLDPRITSSSSVPPVEPMQLNQAPKSALTPDARPYNTNDEELVNLQKILQQMRAENISLKSQLGTYSNDEKYVKEEITRTIEEISSLSKELSSLRAQVTQVNVALVEVTSQLKVHQGKKSALQDLISSEKSTLCVLGDSSNAVQEVLEKQIQTSNYDAQKYSNYEVDLFGYGDIPNEPPPSENPPPEPWQPETQQQLSLQSPDYVQQQQQQPPYVMQQDAYQLQQQTPQPIQLQPLQPTHQQPPQPGPQQQYQQQQPQQTYENENSPTPPETSTHSVSSIDPQQLANLDILKTEALQARQEAEDAKAEYSSVKIKSEQLKQEAEEAQKEYATLQSIAESSKKRFSKKKSKVELEKTQKKADALSKKHLEGKTHVEDAMIKVTAAQKRVDDLISAVEVKEVEIATAESCKDTNGNGNGNGNYHYGNPF